VPDQGPSKDTQTETPRRPKKVVGLMVVVLALAATPLVLALTGGNDPTPTKKAVPAAEADKADGAPAPSGNAPARKNPAKKFPPKPKPCKPKGGYKQRPRLPKNCRRVKP
jgi:hypothetical protein